MVNSRVKLFVIILLILFYDAYSQNQQIDTRKKELESLRTEISILEKELSKKNANEKKSLATYESLSKQSFLVNKLLTSLRREEEQKLQ